MSQPASRFVTGALVPDVREQAARRHPLIPRGKPPCPPLTRRLDQIRTRARNAHQGSGRDQRLLCAAQAHNLAALTASDCGLPELARELCVRQAAILLQGGPYDADTATLALQPLINLGRLLIRSGDGEAAHHLFEHLFTTAKSRSDTVLADIPVNLCHLTTTQEDHRTIIQWLWTVLLSDGTRALTQAGRWHQALQHAQRHNAIGQRLLDGRQTAVLAHSACGNCDHALLLLEDSHTPTPWEQAVTAVLRVLCLSRTDRDLTLPIGEMMRRYLQAEESIREHPAFHIRLGLCVIDLATGCPGMHRITGTVVRAVLDSKDAALARETLAHHECIVHIDGRAREKLNALVDAAGLGKGDLFPEARTDLMEAALISEAVLMEELGCPRLEVPP